MPSLARRPLLLVAAAISLTLACATPRQGDDVRDSAPRGDSKTITQAELASAPQVNLFDLINAERPRWLRPVSTQSFPTMVYVNDSRIGALESLRSFRLSDLAMVRYFDASAAQQRFNRIDLGPVIQVVPRSP